MKQRSQSRPGAWCRRGLRWLGAVVLILGVTGCSAGYVARAAYEEARILWRRESIDDLLARPTVNDATKRKLQLVLDVRRFAAERIGLRVGGSYRSVSTVDGRAVVRLLTASRRDQLEPYTWWFPIVGRVPYKGFFSKPAAIKMAEELESEGYDTYVRPAIAFSTLGWFNDPLPSPLLKHDEVTLAQVIFHELLHNTVFLPGYTSFDESSATFAGYRAAIEFFCEGERSVSDQCRAATADWQDTLTISRFFTKSLADLEAFYATKPTGVALERGRERAFAEIRRQFKELKLHPGRYADFSAGPINNASLLQERIYLHDLDVFDELYREGGSLRAAVRAIRTAVDRGGDPFDRVREALATSRVRLAGNDAQRSSAVSASVSR
jgi:predicted aminopeptidase